MDRAEKESTLFDIDFLRMGFKEIEQFGWSNGMGHDPYTIRRISQARPRKGAARNAVMLIAAERQPTKREIKRKMPRVPSKRLVSPRRSLLMRFFTAIFS